MLLSSKHRPKQQLLSQELLKKQPNTPITCQAFHQCGGRRRMSTDLSYTRSKLSTLWNRRTKITKSSWIISLLHLRVSAKSSFLLLNHLTLYDSITDWSVICWLGCQKWDTLMYSEESPTRIRNFVLVWAVLFL